MYLTGSGSLSLSLSRSRSHTHKHTHRQERCAHTHASVQLCIYLCLYVWSVCIYIYMLTEKERERERERARDARWSLGFTAENTTSSVRIVAFSTSTASSPRAARSGTCEYNQCKDYHQIARAGFFELILFTLKFEANLSRIQANPLRPCTDPARIWAIAFDLTEVQPLARKLQLLVRSRETGLSGRSPRVHSIAPDHVIIQINRKSCDLKSLGFGSQYALLPPLNDQRKRGFVLLQFWNLSQQPVPSNPGPR